MYMIARITGQVQEVSESSVILSVDGGLCYEVMLPACDIQKATSNLGRQIVLHTIHIIEGDPSRGQVIPRLLGFTSAEDREFFKLFTKVKGIGPRKALRAIARPIPEIAAAIESGNTSMLVLLPEIGKRTADTIIAELNGKLSDFTGPTNDLPESRELSKAATEAIAALVQLGEKRPDAESLVQRVLAVAPELNTPEEIIKQVYRLKG